MADEVIDEDQRGFRSSRECANQIFALKLCEKAQNKHVCVCFMDLVTGLKGNYCCIYGNSLSCKRWGVSVRIDSSVERGCAMSYYFNLNIDEITKELNPGMWRI